MWLWPSILAGSLFVGGSRREGTGLLRCGAQKITIGFLVIYIYIIVISSNKNQHKHNNNKNSNDNIFIFGYIELICGSIFSSKHSWGALLCMEYSTAVLPTLYIGIILNQPVYYIYIYIYVYIVNIITILIIIMIYIYILPYTNIGMTFGALDSAQNSLDFHGSVMVRTLFGSRSQHWIPLFFLTMIAVESKPYVNHV